MGSKAEVLERVARNLLAISRELVPYSGPGGWAGDILYNEVRPLVARVLLLLREAQMADRVVRHG